jgi:hypothetical protein
MQVKVSSRSEETQNSLWQVKCGLIPYDKKASEKWLLTYQQDNHSFHNSNMVKVHMLLETLILKQKCKHTIRLLLKLCTGDRKNEETEHIETQRSHKNFKKCYSYNNAWDLLDM